MWLFFNMSLIEWSWWFFLGSLLRAVMAPVCWGCSAFCVLCSPSWLDHVPSGASPVSSVDRKGESETGPMLFLDQGTK